MVGYSRAVKTGQFLVIAGTTAVDDQGQTVGPGDFYAQTRYILEKIGRVLEQAGSSFGDVVRTRTFVTDISRWEEVGRAHGEIFSRIRPAATMVEIRALIRPDLLVEIEMDAILSQVTESPATNNKP